MLISGKVTGLTEGLHGFHVHEFGNIRGSCKSTGGHFNPFNTDHGAHDAKVRHVGDFKQMEADADGVADYYHTEQQATLMDGKANIIGRGLVLHAGEDDLGLGGDAGSLANGNAGARVACCVIGIDQAPAEDSTRKSRKSREMQWGDKVDLGVTWSTKVRAMKEDIEGALKMRLGKLEPTYK
jgi:Cu-Zn family superoxide dismutase